MRSIQDPITGELRDSISRDWTNYLDGLSTTIVPIANEIDDPQGILTDVSADTLLLTNGEDIGDHPPRDETERALLDAAVDEGTPVLGVCRGHQFLNHYFGGDLVVLSQQLGADHAHAGENHDIKVGDGPFTDILPERIEVNSYHDRGVVNEGIAPDLNAFAVADDGVIEGLYHPDHPILSIQWHPERPLPNKFPIDRFVQQFLEGTLSW